MIVWMYVPLQRHKTRESPPHLMNTIYYKPMIDPRTNLPENARTQVVIQCTMDDLRDLLHEAVLLNANSERETEQEPEYITTDQTAERLQVNRSTLWRWNRNKYLCPVKVGRKSLYRMADVNRILKIENK